MTTPKPNGKISKRSSSDTKCCVMIPIVYGLDEKNGIITDEFNPVYIHHEPKKGNMTRIIIDIYDIKDEEAYYNYCGKIPDPNREEKFIAKAPWRADNLRLCVTTSVGQTPLLFDDSEFIGKTAPELMELQRTKYIMDFQTQNRIDEIVRIMGKTRMTTYKPEDYDGNDS